MEIDTVIDVDIALRIHANPYRSTSDLMLTYQSRI